MSKIGALTPDFPQQTNLNHAKKRKIKQEKAKKNNSSQNLPSRAIKHDRVMPNWINFGSPKFNAAAAEKKTPRQNLE